jgi:SNF2 family DNA or RNA helicase
VETQAADRAHRIGQTRPVFVYRLVAEGTVEERILELQDRKRDLAEAVLDAGTVDGDAEGPPVDAEALRALLGA